MESATRQRFALYFAAQHLLSDVLYTVFAAFLWQLHLAQVLESQNCPSSLSPPLEPAQHWTVPDSNAFPCTGSLQERVVWTLLKAPKVLLSHPWNSCGVCYLAHVLVLSVKIAVPTKLYVQFVRSPLLLLARHLPGFVTAAFHSVSITPFVAKLAAQQHGAYWSEGLHFIFASVFLPVPFHLQLVATAVKATELVFMWKLHALEYTSLQLLSRLLSLILPCIFCWYWEYFQSVQFPGRQESKFSSQPTLPPNHFQDWQVSDCSHCCASSSDPSCDTNSPPYGLFSKAYSNTAGSCKGEPLPPDAATHEDMQPSAHAQSPQSCTQAADMSSLTSVAVNAGVDLGATMDASPEVTKKVGGNTVDCHQMDKDPDRVVTNANKDENLHQVTNADRHRNGKDPDEVTVPNARTACNSFHTARSAGNAPQTSQHSCVAMLKTLMKLKEAGVQSGAGPHHAHMALLQSCLVKLEAAQQQPSGPGKPKPTTLYASHTRVSLLSVKVHDHPQDFSGYARELHANVTSALPPHLVPCSSVVIQGCVQLLMWATQSSDAASQEQLLGQAINLFNQLPAVDSKVPDVDIHMGGFTFCFRNGDVASVNITEESMDGSGHEQPGLEGRHTMSCTNRPSARCCMYPACIVRSVDEERCEVVEVKIAVELPKSQGAALVLEVVESGLRVVVQGKGQVLADEEPTWSVISSTHDAWIVGCSVQLLQPSQVCKLHVAILTPMSTVTPSAALGHPIPHGLPIATTSFLALPHPAAEEVLQLYDLMLAELTASEIREPMQGDVSTVPTNTFAPAVSNCLMPIPEADSTDGASTMGAMAVSNWEQQEASGRHGMGADSIVPPKLTDANSCELSEATGSVPSLQSEQSGTSSPTSSDALVEGTLSHHAWPAQHTHGPIPSSADTTVTATATAANRTPTSPGYAVQLEAWTSHFQGFVEDFAHLAMLQDESVAGSSTHDPSVWAEGGPMEQLIEFMTHHSMWNTLQLLLGSQVGVDAVGGMAVKVLQDSAECSSSCGWNALPQADQTELVREHNLEKSASQHQVDDSRAAPSSRTATVWMLPTRLQANFPRIGPMPVWASCVWSGIQAGMFPLQLLGSLIVVRKAKAWGVPDVLLALLLVLLHALLLGPSFESKPRLIHALQLMPFGGLLVLWNRSQWTVWQLSLLSGTVLLHTTISIMMQLMGLSWLPPAQSSVNIYLTAILLHLLHAAASKVPCLPSDAVLAIMRPGAGATWQPGSCCAQPGSVQCTMLMTFMISLGVLVITMLLSSARLALDWPQHASHAKHAQQATGSGSNSESSLDKKGPCAVNAAN